MCTMWHGHSHLPIPLYTSLLVPKQKLLWASWPLFYLNPPCPVSTEHMYRVCTNSMKHRQPTSSHGSTKNSSLFSSHQLVKAPQMGWDLLSLCQPYPGFPYNYFCFHLCIFMHECVNICCLCVQGRQNRVLDVLELELQVVVSNSIWVLGIELKWKGNKCLMG